MKKLMSLILMAVLLTGLCFAGSAKASGKIEPEAGEYDYIIVPYLEEDGDWSSYWNDRLEEVMSKTRYQVVTDEEQIEDYDYVKVMVAEYNFNYNANTHVSTCDFTLYDYKLYIQKRPKKVKLATYQAKSNIGDVDESLNYCFDKVFEYLEKDLCD